MDNTVKKLPGVSQGIICGSNYLPGEIIPPLISQRLQFSVTGSFKAFCQGWELLEVLHSSWDLFMQPFFLHYQRILFNSLLK